MLVDLTGVAETPIYGEEDRLLIPDFETLCTGTFVIVDDMMLLLLYLESAKQFGIFVYKFQERGTKCLRRYETPR
jgi:hypothetical protein